MEGKTAHTAPQSPNDIARAMMLDQLSLISLQIAQTAGHVARNVGLMEPALHRAACDEFSRMIRTYGLIERLRAKPATPLKLSDLQIDPPQSESTQKPVFAAAKVQETQSEAAPLNPLTRMNSLSVARPFRAPRANARPVSGVSAVAGISGLPPALHDNFPDCDDEVMMAAQETINNLSRAMDAKDSEHACAKGDFHQQAEQLLKCLDVLADDDETGGLPP